MVVGEAHHVDAVVGRNREGSRIAAKGESLGEGFPEIRSGTFEVGDGQVVPLE